MNFTDIIELTSIPVLFGTIFYRESKKIELLNIVKADPYREYDNYRKKFSLYRENLLKVESIQIAGGERTEHVYTSDKLGYRNKVFFNIEEFVKYKYRTNGLIKLSTGVMCYFLYKHLN